MTFWRLAFLSLLFPLWYFWPREKLPSQFEWLNRVVISGGLLVIVLALTVVLLMLADLAAIGALAYPYGRLLLWAALLWLGSSFLFLLRSWIHAGFQLLALTD